MGGLTIYLGPETRREVAVAVGMRITAIRDDLRTARQDEDWEFVTKNERELELLGVVHKQLCGVA